MRQIESRGTPAVVLDFPRKEVMKEQTPTVEQEPEVVPALVEEGLEPESQTEKEPESKAPDPEPEKVPEPEQELEEFPSEEIPSPNPNTDQSESLSALRQLIERRKAEKAVLTPTAVREDFSQPPKSDNTPIDLRPTDISQRQRVNHSDYLNDQSDNRVRNFDDLFAFYPIGDGEFTVFVERKHPINFKGMKIGGIQRPIEYRIDQQAFAARYGSGVYQLQVYGPVSSNKLGVDGQPKKKAFTKPIKVEVPDPFGDNPPNPEMAAIAVAEEDQDMPAYNVRRGGASDADAQIETARLEHEADREEKKRLWEERQRDRAEQKAKERERENLNLVQQVLQSKDEELREYRQRQKDPDASLTGVASILAALKPQGPSTDEIARLNQTIEAERRAHSEEKSRMTERHTLEINRIRDEHIRALDLLRNDQDKLLRDERDRNERLFRDREEISRRQLEDQKADYVRQLEAVKSSYEARLSDERRQHDRDLQSRQDMSQNSTVSLQSSFEMRLEVKQNEINRLALEAQQLRKELESEKRKTLVDRVEEFAGAAEALGYAKDEGEKGWKEMLGEAAVGLVQQAPMLAANVMSSLKSGGGQQMMPTQQQMHMLQAPQNPSNNYGPVFATDGVETEFDNTGYYNQEPIPPGADPLEYYTVDEAGNAVPETAGAVVQPQIPTQPQAQQRVPQTRMQAPTQAQQEAIQHVQDEGGDLNISDEQLVQFSGMFREAFTQGATPEQFTDSAIQQLGPFMAGSVVREITLARIAQVLQNAPGGDKDPLTRRDGQKFLSKVWQLVTARTEGMVAGQ